VVNENASSHSIALVWTHQVPKDMAQDICLVIFKKQHNSESILQGKHGQCHIHQSFQDTKRGFE
jgi:hypothetical protein